MPKRSLRQGLLLRRSSIPLEERPVADAAAQRSLLGHPAFVAAGAVAAYVPVRGETATAAILDTVLSVGKRLFLPAVTGDRMNFREVASLDFLRSGAFGIPEPPEDAPERSAGDADIVIVPGVGFDLSGRRIGYGKGYYDRFLHGLEGSGRFFGLCYDFQLQEEIVGEPHDVLMDWVITDRRVLGPLRRS